jgi:hypothetical protein
VRALIIAVRAILLTSSYFPLLYDGCFTLSSIYFVKFTNCPACFVPFAANAFSNAAAPSLNLLSDIFAYLAVIVPVAWPRLRCVR